MGWVSEPTNAIILGSLQLSLNAKLMIKKSPVKVQPNVNRPHYWEHIGWLWSDPVKSRTAFAKVHKKNPQIVGLRLQMCWINFLAGKRNANLQLLCLHSAYQFKVLLHLLPFGRYVRREFWDPHFGGGMWGEELWSRVLRQSKAHPRHPNTAQYKVVRYLQPFGQNSNVKFRPPIRPPKLAG